MRNTTQLTRRQAMKSASAAGIAGVITATAGCLGGGGSGTEGDRVPEIEFLVTTPDYDPIRYEFGVMAAENWRELGIQVEVVPTAWNRIVEQALDAHDFDIFTLRVSGSPDRLDPHELCYSYFHSSQAEQLQRNRPHYQNEEYDEYAEAQASTPNEEERQEHVYNCMELLAEDTPIIPICHPNNEMPYNVNQIESTVGMIGEGLMSFWTMVETEPVEGVSTLRVGYPSDNDTINPLKPTAAHDRQTMRLFYDRLVRLSVEGEPEPWAAETVDLVDDTTYEVTLRDGMQWHDGEEVTAEDIVFTFEFQNEHSSIFASRTDPIEEMEVEENTIIFHLAEPFAPFIGNTLAGVYLIPEHIWGDVENPLDETNDQPVGSGPFIMEEWRREEEMRLVANEEHFNPPNVGEILKIPFADNNSMVSAIEAEEIDFIGWDLPPDTIDRLAEEEHLDINSSPSHGTYKFPMMLEVSPFDDLYFRRALHHATPKEDIIDTLFQGRSTIAHHMIAPANEFWHNPDTMQYEFSLERAEELLDEAGYRWDDQDYLLYPENDDDTVTYANEEE